MTPVTERVIKFRSLYEGVWYYQTLEEMLTITLAAFRMGKHKCQYTGLKDKNGEDIYEGDIIATKFFPDYVERISWKGDPDAICEVTWDLCGFGLNAKGDEDYRYPSMEDINYEETEVIGNIYQNPKLIPE